MPVLSHEPGATKNDAPCHTLAVYGAHPRCGAPILHQTGDVEIFVKKNTTVWTSRQLCFLSQAAPLYDSACSNFSTWIAAAIASLPLRLLRQWQARSAFNANAPALRWR